MFFEAGEATAPDRFLGDDQEPAPDQVEPGGIGGGVVVQVKSRALRQRGLDFGVLVGAVVVDDLKHINLFGYLFDDAPQETEDLLVAVTRLAFCDHRAGGHIQRG